MLPLYLLRKMKLRLIQSNCSAINSIYIYENFLDDLQYLNLLKSHISEYTNKPNDLDYKTNVFAKMTNWKKLLEDQDFNKIHQSIAETLYNTINLRNPCPNQKIEFFFDNSWGMKHDEGDYTQDHIHNFAYFSGSFYFEVPTPTMMWFEDYQQDVELKDNMLVLFPGLCKHRVTAHTGQKPRYSMAFNMTLKVVD